MLIVSVLLPDGAASVGCIEGSLLLFEQINVFARQRGEPPVFEVQTVAADAASRVYDKRISIRPDRTLAQAQTSDLVIVPAVNGDPDEVIRLNQELLPWIQARYKNGSEVASLCVGAFLLAATGLLEGRACSTHWSAADRFRRMYPGVRLQSDSVVTDEAGLYTSGGALSFWNLLLHLVEKHAGRETAVLAAKYFEIDIDRRNQSAFRIFAGQRDHDDSGVHHIQDILEKRWAERLSMDDLAEDVAIGRRSLERRFRKATGNSVAEYHQRVRIEVAKKALESGRKSVQEAMDEAGYNDPKTFRLLFRRLAGLPPLDYRARYGKDGPYRQMA